MITPQKLCLGLLVASLASCDRQSGAVDPSTISDLRPLVLTTIHPLQFFVERLAGDFVDCKVITPDSADPQHWVPSRQELTQLLDADLVIFHGASLEAWSDKVSLPRHQRSTICTGFDSHFLKIEGSIRHTHGEKSHTHDGTDPFLWLSMGLASKQAEVVARALGRLLPAQHPEIKQRLRPLQQELLAAQAAHKAQVLGLQNICATDRMFDYWARSHQIHITNLNLQATPDTKQFAHLQTVVAASKARLVLCPKQPAPATEATLKKLGLQPVVFDPCFTTQPGTDFLQVMAQNHARLQAALKQKK